MKFIKLTCYRNQVKIIVNCDHIISIHGRADCCFIETPNFEEEIKVKESIEQIETLLKEVKQ